MLESGVPVFIMGYGASGSGKTSTLISLKTNTTKGVKYDNGVLLELLKISDGGNINVFVNEFYVTSNYNSLLSGVASPTIDEELYTAKNSSGFYSAPAPSSLKNNHLKHFYTQKKFKKDGGEETDFMTFSNKLIASGTYEVSNNINDNPIKVIEGDMLSIAVSQIMNDPMTRRISPTTNNPESSRSHILLTFQIERGEGKPSSYLFVGDFAGVENEFNCADAQTLIVMANSGIDQKGRRTYTAEMMNIDLQKDDGVCSSQQMGGGNAKQQQENHEPKYPDSTTPIVHPFNVGMFKTAFLTPNSTSFDKYFTNTNWRNSIKNLSDPQLRDFLVTSSLYAGINLSNTDTGFVYDNPSTKALQIEISKSRTHGSFDLSDREFMQFKKSFVNVEKSKTLHPDLIVSGNHTYYLQASKNTKRIQLYSTSETMIDKSITEFMKGYIKYLEDCRTMLVDMKRVCECRVAEGKYINRSISNAQLAIIDLIKASFADRLRISPSITAGCSDVYCNPMFADCFVVPAKSELSSTSYIFKTINDYLNIKFNVERPLAVGVFGVFNAMDKLPNQAYIYDTNLRMMLKFVTNYKFIEFALQHNFIDVNRSNPSNYTKIIRKFLGPTTNHMNLKENIITVVNKVFENLKGWINLYQPVNYEMHGFTQAEVDELLDIFPKKEYDASDDLKTVERGIVMILDAIEKVNAVTPVGTLEFMNSLTKYDFDNHAWSSSCNNEKTSYMDMGIVTTPGSKANKPSVDRFNAQKGINQAKKRGQYVTNRLR
jgi:hypothetical protein